MKTIKCEIQGVTPLLMHSCESMIEQKQNKPTKNPSKQYDDKEEAKKAEYRNKAGKLYVPSRCLKACILNASSWFKFGKKSAKPIIAGCTTITPMELILDKQEYEIDRRPVVVNKGRIIRCRPRFDNWKLKFEIVYNEVMIQNSDIIKEIIIEAGQRVGLLDNRPQKYGENGCFKLTKFTES